MSIVPQKFANLPRCYLLQEMRNYVVEVFSIGITLIGNLMNIVRFIQKLKQNTLCLHTLCSCSFIVKHFRSTDCTAQFPLKVPEYVYTVLNGVCNVFFETIVVGNMHVCNLLQIRACLLSHSFKFMMYIKCLNYSLQICVLTDILFLSSNSQQSKDNLETRRSSFQCLSCRSFRVNRKFRLKDSFTMIL